MNITTFGLAAGGAAILTAIMLFAGRGAEWAYANGLNGGLNDKASHRRPRWCEHRKDKWIEKTTGHVVERLKLTTAQKIEWKKVEDQLRASAGQIETSCASHFGLMAEQTALDRLNAIQGFSQEAMEAYQSIYPLFETFYKSLDPEQQARLDQMFVQRGSHGHGRHGHRRHRHWHS